VGAVQPPQQRIDGERGDLAERASEGRAPDAGRVDLAEVPLEHASPARHVVRVADDEHVTGAEHAPRPRRVPLGGLALFLEEDRFRWHTERDGEIGGDACLRQRLVLAATARHHEPWCAPRFVERDGVAHAPAHRDARRPVRRDAASEHDDGVPPGALDARRRRRRPDDVEPEGGGDPRRDRRRNQEAEP